MMSNNLISVVVPVYNAERYIGECIESILKQSYPKFELILVNDGSSDSSREKCEQHALRDKRITIINQQNQGVSAARNTGIDAASGDFLCFVDADDWVQADYLSDMLNDISPEDGYGLVIHGLTRINPNREVMREVRFPDLKLTGEEVSLAFTEMAVYTNGYSAAKLYSLTLLNRFSIRFRRNIVHAEDMLFMIDYLKHVNYIRFNTKYNYIYEFRSASLSTSNRSYRSEKTCYEVMKQNILELISLFNLRKEDLSQMEEFTTAFLIRALPALFRPPYTLPHKERLRQLKTLSDDDIAALNKYYAPFGLIDKLGKQLLVRRYWHAYERLMSLAFFARYRLLPR